MLDLRPALAALLVAFATLPPARSEASSGSPRPLRWVVAQRDLELGSWRSRLAQGPGGELYLGGGPAGGALPGRVYQWSGEAWRRVLEIGGPGSRTFVLAVDPGGDLWVAPYAPNDDTTYRGLTVFRRRLGAAEAHLEHYALPGI